jgi:hypothetical protein
MMVVQEWFQQPARMNSREKGATPTIPGFRGSQGDGDSPAAPVEFSQRGSFGFGTNDMEDHTSSDAEPGTPRQP